MEYFTCRKEAPATTPTGVVGYPVMPTKAQRVAAAVRAEEEALTESLRRGYRLGYGFEDKGIFIGPWAPIDRDGDPLGIILNVFAAPEDLGSPNPTGKNGYQFVEAAEEVGNRSTRLNWRNWWHGHDGVRYCENDTALYAALKRGDAIGKWFIPPLELLNGRNVNGEVVRDKHHLYGLQNEGDLRGTFATEDYGGDCNFPNHYWSCTEPCDLSTSVWLVRFSVGVAGYSSKALNRMSCRPCRAEDVNPLII